MSRNIYFHSMIAAFVLLTSLPISTIAQSSVPQNQESGGAHKFTFGLGHAYFAEKESGAKNVAVNAYVLNYDYVINKHWSIGSHNDLLIEGRTEKLGTSAFYSTERPMVVKAMGLYSPFKNSHFMFGLGDEINRTHNNLIINLGLDYGFPIAEGWEVAGEISFDNKIHGIDSWIVGFGICKTIRKHHKS
ncbi:MAG: hypothetical protein H7Y07_07915 [Pyrinomonadaceae bacterium]|nr:hypothetical protein [Sphingobacteriaceae bacterium]